MCEVVRERDLVDVCDVAHYRLDAGSPEALLVVAARCSEPARTPSGRSARALAIGNPIRPVAPVTRTLHFSCGSPLWSCYAGSSLPPPAFKWACSDEPHVASAGALVRSYMVQR